MGVAVRGGDAGLIWTWLAVERVDVRLIFRKWRSEGVVGREEQHFFLRAEIWVARERRAMGTLCWPKRKSTQRERASGSDLFRGAEMRVENSLR